MILWTGTAEGHSLVQAWQSIHLEKCAAASGQGLSSPLESMWARKTLDLGAAVSFRTSSKTGQTDRHCPQRTQRK
jgi:hypothetical protein